jgi:6-hydroxycyclohex-1-ene-1-carbonyl-CoA dehydrogenase
VRAALQRVEAPPTGLKVLEMSGSTGGQRLAWSLLNHGAVLVVVGFTREKVELRLGNLMAFDARAIGNWGCSPRHYPAVLELVRAGKVRLEPFIRREPMQEANRVFERVAAHAESRRVVLTNED